MSLPPQVLRVKRKRVDEPVDSLYIEPGSGKRRNTQDGYVFRRLRDDQAVENKKNQTVSTSKYPEVLVTRPGEEKLLDKLVRSRTARAGGQKDATPKRFQLAVGESGEEHVAIFKATPSNAQSKLDTTQSTETMQLATPTTSPRKRPKSKASSSNLAQSLELSRPPDKELLAAMQKHADELDTQASTVTTPAPDAMDLSEDDYVYDTYTRHVRPESTDSTLPTSTPTTASEDGIVGYLVIPEADQTLWETFYDSDAHTSDEQDWDSEQDDENAENYYGADYPEDEVASDDEFGENAYRYRLGKASDDEEYGSEDDEQSEDGWEGDDERLPARSESLNAWRKLSRRDWVPQEADVQSQSE